MQLSNFTMNFLENEIPMDNLEHLAKLKKTLVKDKKPIDKA